MIYNLALIGDPVEHSLSPQIHSKFFELTGLKGGYLYFQVPPQNLQESIKHLQALNFRGVNLTIPHKQAELELADQISAEAKLIGACNTLLFENNKIIAENTDWIGFGESLPEDVRQNAKKVVVLGAGGSARAVMMALNKLGVPKITLLTRDTASSTKNVSEIIKTFTTFDNELMAASMAEDFGDLLQDTDLVINTTPIGMHSFNEGVSPIKEKFFANIKTKNCYFYDLIYNPAETQFMKLAKQYGFRTQNGYAMLQLQAAYAFSLWTGADMQLLKNSLVFS